MSAEKNEAIMRQLFEKVWGTGNVAAQDEYYAAGPYLDDLKRFATALYTACPDWRATIEDLIAVGDQVVVRWSAQGTYLGPWRGFQPTGKQINTTGIDIERIVDGKIVEERSEVDMLGFLQQLGAIPTME